jgi:hypothetical protein
MFPIKHRPKNNPNPAMSALEYRGVVHAGGYEWKPSKDARRGRLLGPTEPLAEDERRDLVLSPLGPEAKVVLLKNDIYLEFSSLGADKDILQFANDRGMLGLDEDEGSVILADDKGRVATGELLSAWKKQIEQMDEACELWRLIQDARAGEPTELSSRTKWKTDPDGSQSVQLLGRRVGDLQGGAWIARGLRPGTPLESLLAGDRVIGPGMYRLAELVNQHGRVSAKLDWAVEPSRPRQKVISPFDLILNFWPSNLISAIWLQLAEAISQRKRARRCWVCSRWMLISAQGGKREERRTCSMRCRKQLSLKRAEAKKMIRGRRSPRSIARHFAVSESRLQEWLSADSAIRSSKARRVEG